MKKAGKIFAFLILGLVMLSFLAGVVSAQKTFEQFLIENLKFFGDTASEIIIAIIILLIIMAGMYDIISIVGIFQSSWVKLIIALGLGTIFSILEWPVKIAAFFMSWGAALGAAGIILEIIVGVVLFIGLVFGSTWAAKFAAKRRGQVETIKAIESAGEAKAAIRGLREIEEEFRR